MLLRHRGAATFQRLQCRPMGAILQCHSMAEGVFIHKPGGGKILGVSGSIASDCYLSKDSVISGKTHVAFMSQIHGGSMLHDVHVSASGISGSVIDGGHISYASVKDSSLENVIVRGAYRKGADDPVNPGRWRRAGEYLLKRYGIVDLAKERRYRTTEIMDCIIGGNVVVEGCSIRGFELNGNFLIHSDFDRQPRHFDLKDIGINLGIIECKCRPGVLSSIIGCKCRTVDLWIERKELDRRLFAKLYNWHPNVVDLIHEYFKGWQGSPR